jgi:hypothetical protein
MFPFPPLISRRISKWCSLFWDVTRKSEEVIYAAAEDWISNVKGSSKNIVCVTWNCTSEYGCHQVRGACRSSLSSDEHGKPHKRVLSPYIHFTLAHRQQTWSDVDGRSTSEGRHTSGNSSPAGGGVRNVCEYGAVCITGQMLTSSDPDVRARPRRMTVVVQIPRMREDRRIKLTSSER